MWAAQRVGRGEAAAISNELTIRTAFELSSGRPSRGRVCH
jgi:hypothetical protein